MSALYEAGRRARRSATTVTVFACGLLAASAAVAAGSDAGRGAALRRACLSGALTPYACSQRGIKVPGAPTIPVTTAPPVPATPGGSSQTPPAASPRLPTIAATPAQAPPKSRAEQRRARAVEAAAPQTGPVSPAPTSVAVTAPPSPMPAPLTRAQQRRARAVEAAAPKAEPVPALATAPAATPATGVVSAPPSPTPAPLTRAEKKLARVIEAAKTSTRPYQDTQKRYRLEIPQGWELHLQGGYASFRNGDSWIELRSVDAASAKLAAQSGGAILRPGYKTFTTVSEADAIYDKRAGYRMVIDATTTGGRRTSLLVLAAPLAGTDELVILAGAASEHAAELNSGVATLTASLHLN